MLYLILLKKFFSSHIDIFKIGPEIDEKLRVEQIKLQICPFQTKSDTDWKCYLNSRKSIASLESKITKLKTEKSIRKTRYHGKKLKPIPINKLPNLPTLIKSFSLKLWVNGRVDCSYNVGTATDIGKGDPWIPTC